MKLTKTQKIILGTTIAGVGGYFLYKYFFPADQESDQESELDKKDTGLLVLPTEIGGGAGGTGGGGVVPLPVTIPFFIGDTIFANQDNIKGYSDINNQNLKYTFFKGDLIGKIDLKSPFSNQYKIRKTNGTFYAPLPDTFFYVDANKKYKK